MLCLVRQGASCFPVGCVSHFYAGSAMAGACIHASTRHAVECFHRRQKLCRSVCRRVHACDCVFWGGGVGVLLWCVCVCVCVIDKRKFSLSVTLLHVMLFIELCDKAGLLMFEQSALSSESTHPEGRA